MFLLFWFAAFSLSVLLPVSSWRQEGGRLLGWVHSSPGLAGWLADWLGDPPSPTDPGRSQPMTHVRRRRLGSRIHLRRSRSAFAACTERLSKPTPQLNIGLFFFLFYFFFSPIIHLRPFYNVKENGRDKVGQCVDFNIPKRFRELNGGKFHKPKPGAARYQPGRPTSSLSAGQLATAQASLFVEVFAFIWGQLFKVLENLLPILQH